MVKSFKRNLDISLESIKFSGGLLGFESLRVQNLLSVDLLLTLLLVLVSLLLGNPTAEPPARHINSTAGR